MSSLLAQSDGIHVINGTCDLTGHPYGAGFVYKKMVV